jgi:RNA polymerase sigma-70 factor, ECF subfamily
VSTVPAVAPRSSAEAALADLYERYAESIYRHCRRRLRSSHEAEDAVQETFVSALRALQRGTVPIYEAAWLFKIAENVCLAVHRTAGRRPAEDLTDSEGMSVLPARERRSESLLGLQEALDVLPPNQRRAFVLRELRGLSYGEIATELGVSVSSVETLIFRARRGLARALDNGVGLAGRVTASLNVGSIVTTVKSWLAGFTAAKAAAGAAVVVVAAVSAGDSVQRPRAATPEPARASVENTGVPAAAPLRAGPTGVGEPARPARSKVRRVSAVGRRTRSGSTPVSAAAKPSPDATRPGKTEAEPPAPAPPTQPAHAAAPPVAPAATAPVVDTPKVKLPEPPALPVPTPVPPPDLSVPAISTPALPAVPDLPVDLPDAGTVVPALPLP